MMPKDKEKFTGLTEFTRVVELSLNHVNYLKFDKEHSWHRSLMGLYLSIVRYSESIIFLINQSDDVGVPLVFRGFLEAYVDYLNLSTDKLYGNYMEANFRKGQLKTFKEAKKGGNPYLEDIARNTKNLKADIAEHEKAINDYKRKGYAPLNQFQKFERAGMKDIYKSIYPMLCSASHNDISALIDRFIDINEDDNTFEINLYKTLKANQFEEFLGSACGMLNHASFVIHDVLNTSYKGQFAEGGG